MALCAPAARQTIAETFLPRTSSFALFLVLAVEVSSIKVEGRAARPNTKKCKQNQWLTPVVFA
jgi:hypothetical protein